MIREILIASLTVIVHGMVDAGDVCLSRGDFEFKSSPIKFEVKRPSFCRRICCDKKLIISGCSIAIVCLVVTLVICIICIANKTRSKPQQLSFMNVCIAQLGLFVFFLVDVESHTVAISFFVDCFLFISVSCLLFEAVAICISVLDKTVHRNVTIAGVSCCWGLPLLKSIITIAVDSSLYYSNGPEEYFLGTGQPLNIAEIVFITLLFFATIAAIGYSVYSLCHASPVNGEEKHRREVWLRIDHISAICLCFFSWIIALLVEGICGQSFCIVFIVFALPQGIVILVGFWYRIPGKKEFCESSGEDNLGRSPSVSPLQDGETIQINSMGATGKAD